MLLCDCVWDCTTIHKGSKFLVGSKVLSVASLFVGLGLGFVVIWGLGEGLRLFIINLSTVNITVPSLDTYDTLIKEIKSFVE